MANYIIIRDKLKKIVNTAYYIFCNKVVGGQIILSNEASMQLHLADILLQVGRLYEFEPNDRFSIELEKKIKISATRKSPKELARIDIWISISDGHYTCSAAIELKALNDVAVTDSRYSVLMDLENLEHYHDALPDTDLLIFEIVYTLNTNFAKASASQKFSLADGSNIGSFKGDGSSYQPILLRNNYPIRWNKFPEEAPKHLFLKLEPTIMKN